MAGIHITLKDGVSARVEEIRINDTYAGQLAGTMTVGTRHRLASIISSMEDLKAGKSKGYYYPAPELVDEAGLMGYSKEDQAMLHRNKDLGKCLKEQHIVATLHFSDMDYCHIIDIHWFQTGRELSEKPLATLLQETAGQLSFGELYPFCNHIDWLEMY